MAKVLKKLTINRARWATSTLCTSEGPSANFCALGFIGHAYGLSNRQLFGRGDLTAKEVRQYGMPAWLTSEEQCNVYRENDGGYGITRSQIESDLRRRFRSHGVELDFTSGTAADKPCEAVFEDDTPAAVEPPISLPTVKALTLDDLSSSSSENKTETSGRKQIVG